MCDKNEECRSQICSADTIKGQLSEMSLNSDNNNGLCISKDDAALDFLTMIGILMVILSIVLVALSAFHVCNKCIDEPKH